MSDNIQETPPVSATESSGATAPVADATPPASSAPEQQPDGDKQPAGSKTLTLNDVVRNAANEATKTQAKQQADADKAAAGDTPAPDAEKDAEPDKPAAADDKKDDTRFTGRLDQHPRFKAVLKERNDARAERDKAAQELATLKPLANAQSALNSYMDRSGLNPKEVAEGMGVMGLMKLKPADAIPHLRRYLMQLEEAVGARLPDDLQNAVEQGHMTEDAAKAQAKDRREAKAARAEVDAERSRREAEVSSAAERARQATASAIEQSVGVWEATWKANDPDYAVKNSFVQDRISALLRTEGPPKTAGEAVKLAERALADVNRQLAKSGMQPRRTEMSPDRGPGRSPTTVVEPKTLLDAVKQGARMHLTSRGAPA